MKRTRLCESNIHDNRIRKTVVINIHINNMAENVEINLIGKKVKLDLEEKKDTSKKEEEETEENNAPECAVCLQPRVHPAELPCHHVFCYLCVKGVVNQSKKCPMCRQDIPSDFLERPRLVDFENVKKTAETTEEEYQWFYEGRNGWWQYDERTSSELELAFKKGARDCELLIAGFLYKADFGLMLQSRKNDPFRRRKIKRDSYNIPKKGVAGLRFNEQHQQQQQHHQEGGGAGRGRETEEQVQVPIVREIRGAERPRTPIIISDDDDDDEDENDDDDEDKDEDEDEDESDEDQDEAEVGVCSNTNVTA